MNRFKKIGGFLIVAFFVFLISPQDIFAASKRAAFCENSDTMRERYNFVIEDLGGGRYRLKMGKHVNDSVFVIEAINYYPMATSERVSYNSPYEFDNPGLDPDTVEIWFTTKGGVNDDKDCPGENSFYLKRSKFCPSETCTEITGTITSDTPIDPGESVTTEAIDCSKSYNPETQSFEYKFCEVKNAAIAAGNGNRNGKNQSEVTLNDLKCGTKFCDGSNSTNCVPTDTSYTMDDEKYYINKQYYHAKTSELKNFEYSYHYAPGYSETESTSCEITCEESLVVEYGPPVASKAGLCFEYKVKVTSRVSCNMTKEPKPPKTEVPYCVPYPNCDSVTGSYHGEDQGGPNEDYKACVQACDGGKYTSKCSKKCYNNVYGKQKSKTTSTSNTVTALKLNAPDAETKSCWDAAGTFSVPDGFGQGVYKGCYYYNGSSIAWNGMVINENAVDAGHKNAPGYWYYLNRNRGKDLSPYIIGSNGFYRRVHADGSVCDDICTWRGCPKGSGYLNPGQAKKDLEENIKKYNQYVAECKAHASCTESTATFTISVDYEEPGPSGYTTKTIDFPYSPSGTKEDKLDSKSTTCMNNELKKGSTILQYAGCYKNDCGPNIWYMTEWSFPGAWINNKTAEISFEDKTDEPGWQTKKNKFCTPKNAGNVNQAWWNYYLKKTMVEKEDVSTERSDYDYIDKCKGTGNDSVSNIEYSSIKDDKIKWNIRAVSKMFGHFHWDITIKCFYALNSTPTKSTPEETTTLITDNPECSTEDENYTTRSVALDDMFPSSEDNPHKTTDPSKTGRPAGFNWTDYAKLGGKTDTGSVAGANLSQSANYLIEPEKYIEKVQTLAYQVYENEEYLDYFFKLGPNELESLRNHKYNSFAEGDADSKDGSIVYYKSEVIERLAKKHPREDVLKCNNIRNYQSTTCED